MRILAFIGALAIAAGLGCAMFFFGGFYSVAGTQEDPAAVTWALTRVRMASINRHADAKPPTSFGNAAMVQAGAVAYASFGCTTCHGGPGVPWRKFSEGLHPDPPDLKGAAAELSPAQLFWVIKNGIKMTGRARRPDLGNRGFRQEASDCLGGRLQDLDCVCGAEMNRSGSLAALMPARRRCHRNWPNAATPTTSLRCRPHRSILRSMSGFRPMLH
jgi:hypothetical protein